MEPTLFTPSQLFAPGTSACQGDGVFVIRDALAADPKPLALGSIARQRTDQTGSVAPPVMPLSGMRPAWAGAATTTAAARPTSLRIGKVPIGWSPLPTQQQRLHLRQPVSMDRAMSRNQ